MPTIHCPTLMIAAPASGQGKTIFTAALAKALTRQHLKVQVFKIGPDYLDPMIHETASGKAVYNLDLWMMGKDHCQQLLFNAAQNNDVILIESLMGLYDNQPSSAEFARLFNIPVLLLMDVSKYAQTAAAIMYGMQHYDSDAPFDLYGVIGNRVGSDNHDRIMQETLKPYYLGSIRRDDRMILPHRHLGLVQAQELHTLNQQLQQCAELLIQAELVKSPPAVEFIKPTKQTIKPLYNNKTIAIAKDIAFSFIYPANIDWLQQQGATLRYFSPLNNEAVPHADMLWLPGGYPELYLSTLANNQQSKNSIRAFCQSNKPVLAECGGFLYLLDKVSDQDGNSVSLCGIIDGQATLEKKFQGLGLQSRNTTDGEIRGHTFHHTKITSSLKPVAFAQKQNGEKGEAVFKQNSITASYLHHYFRGNTNPFS